MVMYFIDSDSLCTHWNERSSTYSDCILYEWLSTCWEPSYITVHQKIAQIKSPSIS